MISSSVNPFWYCASGFSVECAWFFSRDLGELLEADAAVLVAVLHADLGEHAGIVSVPSQPSTGMTAP